MEIRGWKEGDEEKKKEMKRKMKDLEEEEGR